MLSSSNDIERSLLQKAVRRGNEELVETVVKYLINIGDKSWLINRLAIITYEECWNYGYELSYPSKPLELIDQYKRLTKMKKNKNASGLAILAQRLLEGDKSVLYDLEKTDQDAISSVADAANKETDFLNWIKSHDNYKKNVKHIDAVLNAKRKAKFSGDKLMMYAAAYLAIVYPTPGYNIIEPDNNPDFPYWIAIDKHTELGKEIYEEACKEVDLLPVRAMRLGFYMEGSLCNQMEDSPFWDYIKQWEMKRMGLTLDQAQQKWDQLKPCLIQLTKKEVENLLERINSEHKKDTDQFELF